MFLSMYLVDNLEKVNIAESCHGPAFSKTY